MTKKEYDYLLFNYENKGVIPVCNLNIETEIYLCFTCPWCEIQFWIDNSDSCQKVFHCPSCCMELEIPSDKVIDDAIEVMNDN